MLVIDLESVHARRGERTALCDVSFRLEPGTLTAVIGPNGAGKSTLFSLLSGRLRPSAGSLRVVGAVADVLQATTIDPQLRLTVEDVVRMGRYANAGLLHPLRAQDRRLVHRALDRVGILPLRRRPIGELSGGQRQRALVAQGLAQDAPILLLDEPSAGLDLPSQRLVMEVARAEAEAGRTVVFSTHSLDEAEQADLVIALACRCLCCAPPDAVMARTDVIDLFGPHRSFGPHRPHGLDGDRHPASGS